MGQPHVIFAILACLNQFFLQILPGGHHLKTILVDDGNTDGSGDAVQTDFSDVRLVDSAGEAIIFYGSCVV